MPIPPTPDWYSAQVVFRGKSGTPSDVYTNTFYFRNSQIGQSQDDVANNIADALETFYTVPPTNVATPQSLTSRMGGNAIEAAVEIRVYDLGTIAPRYPKLRNFTVLDFPAGAMPSEVAACLSYVAGENQPRSRGRIYLGPLNNTTVTHLDGRAVVTDTFRHSTLASADRLMQDGGVDWGLWSPTSGQMKIITGCWMDDSFDTQRRRGEEARNRVYTGTYLGQSGTPLPTVP